MRIHRVREALILLHEGLRLRSELRRASCHTSLLPFHQLISENRFRMLQNPAAFGIGKPHLCACLLNGSVRADSRQKILHTGTV